MITGRIFISYSHDSERHREIVLQLADQLRNKGVDCEIDRYYDTDPPEEGWPRWMRRMLEEAETVLVVCSETYRRRYEGLETPQRGLGANWEGAIITQELYEDQLKQRKFLPLCLQASDVNHIPIELRATTHYILPRDYVKLYRRLTRQPELSKPPLGILDVLPSKEPGRFKVGSDDRNQSGRRLHNLPFPPNPVFQGRGQDIERLRAACQTQTVAAITQTAAVTGLGGIGKTQLAIEYGWEAMGRGDYTHVLWVRGGSVQSIDADIASLASVDMLDLPEAALNEEASARRAVLRWLTTTPERWLLIADNVDGEAEIESLRDQVPIRSNGHVILTSRNERWPGFTSVVLDTLGAEAAVKVLRACIRRDAVTHEPGSDDEAIALATELGFLPLALEQAAAVIANRRWTFARYLDVFRTEGARLRKAHQIDNRRYPDSIATTWLVTLDKLSLRAHIILQLASWLAPDEIPRALFVENGHLVPGLEKDQNLLTPLDVEEALSELSSLSLIRLTASTFSVHRLLQAVEQDQLDGVEARGAMLMLVAILIEAFVPERPENFQGWGRWIVIRPHVEQMIAAASANSVHRIAGALASQLAVFLAARGEFSEAVRFARLALETARSDSDASVQQLAVAASNLGAILEGMNELSEAEPLLRESVELIAQAPEASKHDRAFAFNNYALLLRSRGRLEEAEAYYRKAVALYDNVPEKEQGSLPKTLGNLGLVLKVRAKDKESEAVLKRALGLAEKLRGAEHPDVAHALNDLGFLYRDLGRYDEAEALLLRALGIVETVFDSENRYLAAILDNLGSLMRLTGRPAEAEPMLRRGMEVSEAMVGPEHPDFAINLVNLGVLLLETGRAGEAERLFRRALRIDELGLGPDHHEVANDLDRLADLLFSVGRPREAEALTKRALRIAEDQLSAGHPMAVRQREKYERLRAYRRQRRGT